MPTVEMLVDRPKKDLARIIIEQTHVVRRLRGENHGLLREIDQLKRGVRDAEAEAD